MRTSMLAAIVSAAALAGVASADVVTQWNFNGSSATTVPGGASSPTTSVGSGTASLLGGVTASFASGTSNGGSSDPVTTTPSNYGWNVTGFAAQGAEDQQRGVSFAVSTVGYDSVVVSWDQRHSNTSSAWVQFLYTLDGVSYTNAGLANGGLFQGTSGDTWFNGRTVDLSGISGAANNASFGFRIVATFAPGSSAYAASNPGSNYAGTGTWRFDMVTVAGNVVPAPGAAALLALAGFVASRRRR